MPSEADLVIRGGTVADGRGGEPFEADVAIAGGRIVEVGRVTARGAEEMDARGLLVTPGFIDVHTHYDAQATWSSRLSSSPASTTRRVFSPRTGSNMLRNPETLTAAIASPPGAMTGAATQEMSGEKSPRSSAKPTSAI